MPQDIHTRNCGFQLKNIYYLQLQEASNWEHSQFVPGRGMTRKGKDRRISFKVHQSRCADFKFFSNTDLANLSGLTAAEVGFLVVKPFKKHSTNRGQTGNAPLPTSPNLRCFQGVEAKKYVCPSSLASSTNLRAA